MAAPGQVLNKYPSHDYDPEDNMTTVSTQNWYSNFFKNNIWSVAIRI